MDDLSALIERYVVGELSEAELAELSQWLKADEANRQMFLAQIDFFRTMQGALVQDERSSAADDSTDLQLAMNSDSTAAALALAELARLHDQGVGQPVLLQPDPPFSPRIEVSARTKLKARLIIAGGLAAVIAISGAVALVVSMLSQPGQEPAPIAEEPDNQPVAVATLTAQRDAQWSFETPKTGELLYDGQALTLTKGFAEITTTRGAIAILEAPCSIELIDNDNAIRLLEGKLVGVCETDSSKGFLVHTPFMDVTDLGTRFGVEVLQAKATEVHVFEGSVQVDPPAGSTEATFSQTLSVGDAVRVEAEDQSIARIDAEPKRFASATPTARRFLAHSTGMGLTVNQIDPNWKIVTFQGKPVTGNHPLRVTDRPERGKFKRPTNGPVPYQWLIVPEALARSIPQKERVRNFTCRTSFELPGDVDLNTQDLVLGFQGGRAVSAVRVNGKALTLPAVMTDKKSFYNPFESQVVSHLLRQGTNTIEIDLYETDERTTFCVAMEVVQRTP